MRAGGGEVSIQQSVVSLFFDETEFVTDHSPNKNSSITFISFGTTIIKLVYFLLLAIHISWIKLFWESLVIIAKASHQLQKFQEMKAIMVTDSLDVWPQTI